MAAIEEKYERKRGKGARCMVYDGVVNRG